MRFMLVLRCVSTTFEFDGYTYHYVKEQMKEGIVSPEFSGGVRVTDKERTIVDSIKDINLIAGLEEVLSVCSVRE